MEHNKTRETIWLTNNISSYASLKAIIAVRIHPTIWTQTVFLLVQIYNHYMIKAISNTRKQFLLPHATSIANQQGTVEKLWETAP